MGGSGRFFWAFFILLSFTPAGVASADQANPRTSFSMDHHQHSMGSGSSQGYVAVFGARMIGVEDCPRKRIAENRCGFFKAYAVLSPIGVCFFRRPFEDETNHLDVLKRTEPRALASGQAA